MFVIRRTLMAMIPSISQTIDDNRKWVLLCSVQYVFYLIFTLNSTQNDDWAIIFIIIRYSSTITWCWSMDKRYVQYHIWRFIITHPKVIATQRTIKYYMMNEECRNGIWEILCNECNSILIFLCHAICKISKRINWHDNSKFIE